MIRRTLYIYLEHGEPRTGLWCDSCALPSVFEVDLLNVTDHGVSKLGTFRHCTEEEDVD